MASAYVAAARSQYDMAAAASGAGVAMRQRLSSRFLQLAQRLSAKMDGAAVVAMACCWVGWTAVLTIRSLINERNCWRKLMQNLSGKSSGSSNMRRQCWRMASRRPANAWRLRRGQWRRRAADVGSKATQYSAGRRMKTAEMSVIRLNKSSRRTVTKYYISSISAAESVSKYQSHGENIKSAKTAAAAALWLSSA